MDSQLGAYWDGGDSMNTPERRIPVTKYNQMLTAFSADFHLIKERMKKFAELDELSGVEKENLLQDIDLLLELEWNLRIGKLELVKKEVK